MTDQVQEAVQHAGVDATDTGMPLNFHYRLSQIGELLPPWWSRAREKALEETWRDGAYLSGVMFNAVAKLATIPFQLVPKDPTISSHQTQAAELTERITLYSEFGQGLPSTMERFAEAYLGHDTGGFIEVLGAGPKIDFIRGPVHSLRSLDPYACTLTGNPEFPVTVQEGSKVYKLHWSRVIHMAQMSSNKGGMNGVGFSSVSRSVKIAKDLITMLNYKGEKMGSRPKNMMLAGKNVTGVELLQAVAVADEMMTMMGLENFARIIAIGGPDMEINKIDLNSMDPFDEKVSVVYGLYAIAMCWGLEANEVVPVATSSGNEQIALQRSRGKLPALFINQLSKLMATRVAPAHMKPVMEHTDDQADHQRAVIEDIWARLALRNLQSGATTQEVERRRQYERGAISREMFVEMQLDAGLLEDGSPVGKLFFDDRYTDLLPLNRALLVPEDYDQATAMREIHANEAFVLMAMGQTSSQAQQRRAREAMAALQWLGEMYTFQRQQQAIEVTNTDVGLIGTGADSNDPGSEEGGVTKNFLASKTRARLMKSLRT